MPSANDYYTLNCPTCSDLQRNSRVQMTMQQETIEGVVEDIIFHNPDTGWTVLSLSSPDPRRMGEETIVVGKLLELQPGETVRFTGSWTVHKEYGQQFKADAMHLVRTEASAQTYLASGLIEGVSKQTARQILTHFGAKALEILDETPTRIHEVPGIATKRAHIIAESWAEQRHSRKVMVFLQDHGITAGLAHKIYETYGEDTIKEIQADPYQLALDVEGVGFKTADQIARGMGLSLESSERVRAGVLHALATLSLDGHVYAPRPLVAEKTAEILDVPLELCDPAITALIKKGDVISVKSKQGPSGNLEVLYSPTMFENETGAAQKLLALATAKKSALKTEKAIARIGSDQSQLSVSQPNRPGRTPTQRSHRAARQHHSPNAGLFARQWLHVRRNKSRRSRHHYY